MFGYDTNGFYGMRDLVSDDEAKKVVQFIVKRVESALFYTATHKVQIFVDDVLIVESSDVPSAMRDNEMREWVRSQIRQNRAHLSQLGVNARAEFVKFGGDPNDLYMY